MKQTIFVQVKRLVVFYYDICIFTIFVYIRPFDLFLFSNLIGFKIMLSKLKPQEEGGGGGFELRVSKKVGLFLKISQSRVRCNKLHKNIIFSSAINF